MISRTSRVLLTSLVLSATLAVACLSSESSANRAQAARERTAPSLTAALEAEGLALGAPIFIRIFKESSELEVWIQHGERFVLFRTYEICTYSGDLGPKLKQGDRQSPEGFYFVNSGRMNPASGYHLSFNLGYPNAYDRAHGRTGDFLMVHGACASIGCYAMTDAGIEEIYTLADAALNGGQEFFRVHAFPFRMTDANLAKHQGSEWDAFWRNLQQGYDWFEQTGRPPNVEVTGGNYQFESE